MKQKSLTKKNIFSVSSSAKSIRGNSNLYESTPEINLLEIEPNSVISVDPNAFEDVSTDQRYEIEAEYEAELVQLNFSMPQLSKYGKIHTKRKAEYSVKKSKENEYFYSMLAQMRIDVANLYEEAKNILHMSPEVSVNEDEMNAFTSFMTQSTNQIRKESKSVPKKKKGLNEMMEQKEELLKILDKKSFWNPACKMDILRESDKKNLYSYLVLQRDKIKSDVKSNYYNSLITEQSLKFNHISCLGKISVIPSWKLDKTKNADAINAGLELADKQQQKPGDWSKSLRGGKEPINKLDKKPIKKKNTKKDYLAESKKVNLAAKQKLFDRNEILKNFPITMKEPKFEQFKEAKLNSDRRLGNKIDREMFKLLTIFKTDVNLDKEAFIYKVQSLLKITDQDTRNYTNLLDRDQEAFDTLRKTINEIYYKFYNSQGFLKLLKFHFNSEKVKSFNVSRLRKKDISDGYKNETFEAFKRKTELRKLEFEKNKNLYENKFSPDKIHVTFAAPNNKNNKDFQQKVEHDDNNSSYSGKSVQNNELVENKSPQSEKNTKSNKQSKQDLIDEIDKHFNGKDLKPMYTKLLIHDDCISLETINSVEDENKPKNVCSKDKPRNKMRNSDDSSTSTKSLPKAKNEEVKVFEDPFLTKVVDDESTKINSNVEKVDEQKELSEDSKIFLDEVDLNSLKLNILTKPLIESLSFLVYKDPDYQKNKLSYQEQLAFYSECSRFQNEYEEICKKIGDRLQHNFAQYRDFQDLTKKKLAPVGLDNAMKMLDFIRKKLPKDEDFANSNEITGYLLEAEDLNNKIYELVYQLEEKDNLLGNLIHYRDKAVQNGTKTKNMYFNKKSFKQDHRLYSSTHLTDFMRIGNLSAPRKIVDKDDERDNVKQFINKSRSIIFYGKEREFNYSRNITREPNLNTKTFMDTECSRNEKSRIKKAHSHGTFIMKTRDTKNTEENEINQISLQANAKRSATISEQEFLHDNEEDQPNYRFDVTNSTKNVSKNYILRNKKKHNVTVSQNFNQSQADVKNVDQIIFQKHAGPFMKQKESFHIIDEKFKKDNGYGNLEGDPTENLINKNQFVERKANIRHVKSAFGSVVKLENIFYKNPIKLNPENSKINIFDNTNDQTSRDEATSRTRNRDRQISNFTVEKNEEVAIKVLSVQNPTPSLKKAMKFIEETIEIFCASPTSNKKLAFESPKPKNELTIEKVTTNYTSQADFSSTVFQNNAIGKNVLSNDKSSSLILSPNMMEKVSPVEEKVFVTKTDRELRVQYRYTDQIQDPQAKWLDFKNKRINENKKTPRIYQNEYQKIESSKGTDNVSLAKLDQETEKIIQFYTDLLTSDIKDARTQYKSQVEDLKKITLVTAADLLMVLSNNSINTQHRELMKKKEVENEVKKLKDTQKTIDTKVKIYHQFLRVVQKDAMQNTKESMKNDEKNDTQMFAKQKTLIKQGTCVDDSPNSFKKSNTMGNFLDDRHEVNYQRLNNTDDFEANLGGFEENLGKFDKFKKYGVSNRVGYLLKQSNELRDLLGRKPDSKLGDVRFQWQDQRDFELNRLKNIDNIEQVYGQCNNQRHGILDDYRYLKTGIDTFNTKMEAISNNYNLNQGKREHDINFDVLEKYTTAVATNSQAYSMAEERKNEMTHANEINKLETYITKLEERHYRIQKNKYFNSSHTGKKKP